MIEFVPLKAEHAMLIEGFEGVHAGYEITPETALMLEEVGGVAAIDCGRVLAIAGILPRWDGVGLAWAWLSRGWRKYARRITAEIIMTLEASNLHRVEMGVRYGFSDGERWAKRLGFDVETPLARKWGPDGRDYSIWVRLK